MPEIRTALALLSLPKPPTCSVWLLIATPCAAACGNAPAGGGEAQVTGDPARALLQVASTDGLGQERIAEYAGAPFEDRKGHLWFSTVQEGVIRYDGKEFLAFTTEDGLAGNTVRGIVEDEGGQLWMATSGGVTTYDGEAFTSLTDYGDLPATYSFSSEPDHREIWDVLWDREGTLWVATMAGVFRYDGETLTPFPMPVVATEGSYEFTPTMVYEIYQDQEGNLWFGTDGAGVVRWDGTETVVYTAKEHGLCSDRVCTTLQDRRGDYWFGTSDGGVSRFDGETFSTHLRTSTRSKHSGWGRYMGILEDRAGHIWFCVASASGGIYRYDGADFRYFSRADGLGKGGVSSVRADRKGALWFGTSAGVFRLDGERFVLFGKSE